MSDTNIYSAYHGSDDVKQVFIGRMKAHMQADELIRGVGFKDGRGCAVGCTLDGYNHDAYPDKLGMPAWVAYLNDTLHEHTSEEVWPTLQLRFLKAIKPGANLNNIYHPICAFSLGLTIEGIEKMSFHNASKKQIIDSIAAIKRLHDIKCNDFVEWKAAARAARAAARTARTAARAAAEAAEAAEAADAAVRAARAAARAAAEAAGTWRPGWEVRKAQGAVFDKIAEEFIRLVELEEGNGVDDER